MKTKSHVPYSALTDYVICPSCQIVSRDHKKRVKDDKCPRCGGPREGAKLFFPRSVVSLVCLMEEMLPPLEEKDERKGREEAVFQHRAAGMVILYCNLVEVLLQCFLEKFMTKVGIPDKVQVRLFKDNVSVNRRIWELFLTITDVEWKDAVRMLKTSYGVKVLKIIKFYNQVAQSRNRFLFGGLDAMIPDELPRQCLVNVPPLLNLFVALHNEYIARLVF
jgi:hypothetical protein